MRDRVALVVVLLVSGGCGAPAGPSTSGGASAYVRPSPSSPASVAPSANPTRAPTASPASTVTAACPASGEAISVATYLRAIEAELEDGGPACFGSRDVTLLGWADVAPGIGFEPPGIEPGWLWAPTGALWDQNCDQDCGFLWVHVDPDSDVEWQADGRWVVVTGHTRDPLADTCHWVYPSDWTGERPPGGEAQEQCRGSFVVVSVARTPNVP